jgi:hypothetical protein
METIRLDVHGIVLELSEPNEDGDRAGKIIASQLTDGSEPKALAAALNALESILLAHACAGIDVSSPAYLCGFETAIDACVSHYD